jgi:hypothetical protein
MFSPTAIHATLHFRLDAASDNPKPGTSLRRRWTNRIPWRNPCTCNRSLTASARDLAKKSRRLGETLTVAIDSILIYRNLAQKVVFLFAEMQLVR